MNAIRIEDTIYVTRNIVKIEYQPRTGTIVVITIDGKAREHNVTKDEFEQLWMAWGLYDE